MLTVSPPIPKPNSTSPMRLINLRSDLAQLADLIELCFQSSLDESGRAAIREMRYMSRLGVGLSVLSRLNELALGINLGYVWEIEGKIVGNVSVFPAQWHKDLGSAWIVANVAVHPTHRRQGIAQELMHAGLDLIREKGGNHAILQVNYDNYGAIDMYENLGFVRERAFTTWHRSSLAHNPPITDNNIFITRRRSTEWRKEYDFVERLRPNEKGGIGWLTPLHHSRFHSNLWQRFINSFSFNNTEYLVARESAKSQDILASLWVENPLGAMRTRIHLFADDTQFTPAVPALVSNALRRFRNSSFVLEHPHDDEQTNELLQQLNFKHKRTVWHMRLTF